MKTVRGREMIEAVRTGGRAYEEVADDCFVEVSKNQASAGIPGETVIMNAQAGTYHSLDGVAAHIWELIQSPLTVGELKASVGEVYQVDDGKLDEDIALFLHELAGAGLIDLRCP